MDFFLFRTFLPPRVETFKLNPKPLSTSDVPKSEGVLWGMGEGRAGLGVLGVCVLLGWMVGFFACMHA